LSMLKYITTRIELVEITILCTNLASSHVNFIYIERLNVNHSVSFNSIPSTWYHEFKF